MGCSGDREKGVLDETQKWDYVTLSDFHASGTLAYFSYAWLWALGLIAVSVYTADTFTAINLLAYDRWSSEIQPTIPLKYAKWIFAACIIISWALCIFEWVRAIRIIRRGSVAESYTDALTVTLQSMRPQGWRRFLVFAELTKSKKGVDYIALFVYFSFRGAIRIMLAEAPRQVVNAITLYNFMQAEVIPTGTQTSTENRSAFAQFWVNVENLAEANREQAVVLFSMLFTLIIWVISALSLIIAVVLYLLFLWHYIPQKDGRLSIYCRRKIDRRLEKIMGQKVKQALEEQEKEQAKAGKKAGELPTGPPTKRQPTLPQMGTPQLGDHTDFGLVKQDARPILQNQNQRLPPARSNTAPLASIQRKPTLPDVPESGAHQAMRPTRNNTAPPATLQRQRTLPDGHPTMPPPARTNTAPPMPFQRQPTLPEIDMAEGRPSMPYRSDTEASARSNVTYASDAPLLGNADEMGYSDDVVYAPTQPRPTFDRQMSCSTRPMPQRTMTGGSQQLERSHFDSTRDANWQYQQERTNPMTYEDSHDDVYGIPMHQGAEDSHNGIYGMPLHQNAEFSHDGFYSTPLSQTAEVSHNGLYGMPMHQPMQQTAEDSHDGFYNTPLHQDTEERTGYSNPISPQRQRTQTATPSQRPFPPPLTRMGSGLSFTTARQASPPEPQSFEMTSQPRPTNTTIAPLQQNPSFTTPQQPMGGYVAFKPAPSIWTAPPPPQRSFTNPPEVLRPTLGSGPKRSFTAPPEAQGPYDDLLDEYGPNPVRGSVDVGAGRSASVAPHQEQYRARQEFVGAVSARSATVAPQEQYARQDFGAVPARSATAHEQYGSRQEFDAVPARSATVAPQEQYATQDFDTVPVRSATAHENYGARHDFDVAPARSASAAPRHERYGSRHEW